MPERIHRLIKLAHLYRVVVPEPVSRVLDQII